MAQTSSLNYLLCSNPYQTPQSLNAFPLFTEKKKKKNPLFHRKVLRCIPFPKIGSCEKRKSDSNRSEVESQKSRKIDSELPIRVTTEQCLRIVRVARLQNEVCTKDIFQAKRSSEVFPKSFEPFFCGSTKIPRNSCQNSKFPCRKSRKIHRRASAGAQGGRIVHSFFTRCFLKLGDQFAGPD